MLGETATGEVAEEGAEADTRLNSSKKFDRQSGKPRIIREYGGLAGIRRLETAWRRAWRHFSDGWAKRQKGRPSVSGLSHLQVDHMKVSVSSGF